MATTIKSPQEGYTGTTSFGPLTLNFKDGEASTDEKLTDGHKAYFKAHGFKVSGSRAAQTSDADKAEAEAKAKAEAEKKAKEEADAKAAADAEAAKGGVK